MKSDRNFYLTLILAVFLGAFGIDRFYAGRIGLGILKLIFAGGFGIWVILDVIFLVTNNYKDSDGKYIKWS